MAPRMIFSFLPANEGMVHRMDGSRYECRSALPVDKGLMTGYDYPASMKMCPSCFAGILSADEFGANLGSSLTVKSRIERKKEAKANKRIKKKLISSLKIPASIQQKHGSPEYRVNKFIKTSKIDPSTDEFLMSFEWAAMRTMAFKQYGTACQCCGASPKTGAVLNVDHIKPRKLFPELALDIKNLQVLCGPCNKGKGNWDQTDWRAAA